MSVGGVWEFIKGLTARVICLEDALNLKNMEIETLNQRLTQLGLVVNEITKETVVKKASTYSYSQASRLIKPANNSSFQLNTSNQRINSQQWGATNTGKRVVPTMKTPQKKTLSTSQSSQRSLKTTPRVQEKTQIPQSARNKLDKIQGMQSKVKSSSQIKKVPPQMKNIYINIAQVTQQTEENEQFYDQSNILNESEEPYKIIPVEHEDKDPTEVVITTVFCQDEPQEIGQPEMPPNQDDDDDDEII